MRAHVVIPAAGSGSRLAADRPKQYLMLLGRSVLAQTLSAFTDPRFLSLTLALAADDDWYSLSDLATLEEPRLRRVTGGASRQQSVLNALHSLQGQALESDWIFVHDAARPCLLASDLGALFAALDAGAAGALLAAPVADTLKQAGADGCVAATVPREGLWRALTPQVFRYGALRTALTAAEAAGITYTDDTAAMEQQGVLARLVRGRDDNLKITQGQDLLIAEQILRTQIAQGLRPPV